MATVTSFTAERIRVFEASIVDGARISTNNLIFHRRNGTEFDVGSVRGPQGLQGAKGDPGSGWLATELGVNVDLNTIVTPGIYTQKDTTEAASGTNYPTPQAGALEVKADPTAGQIFQIYHTYGPINTMYIRGRYNSAWSAWKLLAADGTFSKTNYGTLSSGPGTPVGGYEKKANGRLTCWVRCGLTPVTNNFTSRKWTYPVAFLDSPAISVTASSSAETVQNAQEDAGNNLYANIGVTRSNTTTTTISAIAEGFWA